MTGIVVVQARSGSTRLPGKVLLDFHGLPLVVLVAMRAASTGRKVVVATSDERSDDAVAEAVTRHGIACERGSLQNVLGRITQALRGCDDDTVIARLTADNVIPDGNFLDEVEQEFLEGGYEYLSTATPDTGLPYGLSVEFMRARHLREADSKATTAYDREHVTPYIRRKFPTNSFLKYQSMGMSAYRATIDCMDDFISVWGAFPEGDDPTTVDWKTLVRRLPQGCYQPTGPGTASGMVLGTAQLGMPYGLARSLPLEDGERERIIKTAIGDGVACLDTARAYGRSEEVIGATLARGWSGRCKVVTKLSPLSELGDNAPASTAAALAENSVLRSCVALRQPRLDVLLLHRARHLSAWDGSVWSRLLELQAGGRVKTLGVSVQSPAELVDALDHPQVEHVQLPCNILDGRWEAAVSQLDAAREGRSITVHARSPLLQGLLVNRDPMNWQKAHVGDPGRIITWLEGLARECGFEGVLDLCLAWVRSQRWIDGVVIGCDNLEQLIRNLTSFRNPTLEPLAMERAEATRPRVDEATVDPAMWAA